MIIFSQTISEIKISTIEISKATTTTTTLTEIITIISTTITETVASTTTTTTTIEIITAILTITETTAVGHSETIRDFPTNCLAFDLTLFLF